MAEFNAYLKFNGNCREAMAFYQDCFGGKLDIMTVDESPVKDQMPVEMHDKIMHSQLTSGSIMIMGSDLVETSGFVHGTTVSLVLVCKSKEEIESLFARLSAGGKVVTPLREEFFGLYAELIDKYGFSWLLQYGEGQT